MQIYNEDHKPLKLDEKLIGSPNLVDRLPTECVDRIGHQVIEDFLRDKGSRREWEERNNEAMKLALQVAEKKTFPWEGAANVKFPLITISAIQYQSRAYPALVNGPHPVAVAPLGVRPNPKLPPGLQQAAQKDQKAAQLLQQLQQAAQKMMFQWSAMEARCERIAHHMAFQILEQDDMWEEHQDKALLIQAIMGCVFKKTYFDTILGHPRSLCVNPQDLVVSYYSKSIEAAPRISHFLPLFANEVHERQVSGLFCEFPDDCPPPYPILMSSMMDEVDLRQGMTPDAGDTDVPYEFIEQCCTLDLDDDGYAEPYVATVRFDTRQLVRLVARFTSKDVVRMDDGRIIRINPIQPYTKYSLIPSPDGGFYDLGLGSLLGPINETIDSAINQLLDAGTMANAGGGFLGRGFRNKKGEYRFRPGEWKSVDSSGDDLRKNILPLPAPEPSNVLFSLLTLLIEYGESIAGATDILQGKNPGQNTPAETSRAMVEQGMKVFNGIYKRTHRAMTQEFRKLFRLNTIFITEDAPYFVGGGKEYQAQLVKDYADANLVVKPSADPFYMSDAQRFNQAAAVVAASQSSPGYNIYEVQKYYLESLKVPSIDRFLPDPQGPYAVPPPVNPKIQIEQIKQQTEQAKLQAKQASDQLDMKLRMMELMQKAELMAAQIRELESRALMEQAQAKGVDAGHAIAMMEMQIAAKKAHMEGLLEAIKLLHETSTSEKANANTGGPTGVAPAPSKPSPAQPAAQQAVGAFGAMVPGSVPK